MAAPDDDQQLLKRIAAGDEEAVRLFQQIHTESLVRAARTNGLGAEDCKDAAQETLIGAIQQIQSRRFRGEAATATWLHAILKHKIIDYWRVYFRRDAPLVQLESVTNQTRDPSLFGTCEIERAIHVREVLASLPRDLRSILLLNVTAGWTIAQIAATMKLRPGTVGRKLAEAKDEFRKKVTGSLPIAADRWATSTAAPKILPTPSDEDL